MTPEQLAVAYLDALEQADLEKMLALFASDGVVHSPLYGPTPVADYYRGLFADTSSSTLTLRGVTQGSSTTGGGLVTIWFHYDWLMSGGQRVLFDVVDVLELDEDGHIEHLHIVYDTVDSRPAIEEETGRPSYRAASLT